MRKHGHYTLHSITLKNVMHYSTLQLHFSIIPCLTRAIPKSSRRALSDIHMCTCVCIYQFYLAISPNPHTKILTWFQQGSFWTLTGISFSCWNVTVCGNIDKKKLYVQENLRKRSCQEFGQEDRADKKIQNNWFCLAQRFLWYTSSTQWIISDEFNLKTDPAVWIVLKHF